MRRQARATRSMMVPKARRTGRTPSFRLMVQTAFLLLAVYYGIGLVATRTPQFSLATTACITTPASAGGASADGETQKNSPKPGPTDSGPRRNLTTMEMLQEAFPEMPPSATVGKDGSQGHVAAFPTWIQTLCPEVVEYMDSFPYFRRLVGDLSILTSLHAAHLLCTVKLAVQVAASVGSPIYLHAGSHLGALLHGGPIPWDDDADLILPYERRQAFIQACNALNETLPILHPDIMGVNCLDIHNAIKANIVTKDSVRTRRKWMWPFVDVFSFRLDPLEGDVVEVSPNGTRRRADRMMEHFRTHPYYFGGLHVLGPVETVALQRYKANKCVLATWTHRLETLAPNGSKTLDCETLKQVFPFVNRTTSQDGSDVVVSNGYSRDGWSSRRVLPFASPNVVNATFAQQTWGSGDTLSISNRRAWTNGSGPVQALNLTRQIPNLDKVEVDNGIADPTYCPLDRLSAGSSLRIVEFNAERGRHWLQAVPLLKSLDADVIILNEMDIGMARSGQQHTTQLLAHALGMNYAWGLEFVELTRGTKQEQEETVGLENSLGLHGNAILSRCTIVDPVVVRDNNIGPFYSVNATSTNANGYEKRLGGRMALLVKIQSSGNGGDGDNETRSSHSPQGTVVVGSTHKLARDEAYAARIRDYKGAMPAIIAGDQDWAFCDRVGLAHVDDASHATWPASCTSDGRTRGDIICSNMDVAEPERTIRPCAEDDFGLKTTLSDHGITYVSLLLPSAH